MTDVDWAAGKATLCDIFQDRSAAFAAADAAAVRAELRALLAQVEALQAKVLQRCANVYASDGAAQARLRATAAQLLGVEGPAAEGLRPAGGAPPGAITLRF